MAEGSPLSVVIDADISKLQKAIADVKNLINDISSSAKNNNLGDFGKGLEQTLSQINTRLNQLEGNLQKTSTTAKAFTTGSKDARTALTSLSLVAQDAPFGFIAIQNNLPGVIQSFGELSRTSNGVKGALSQISQALIGPAGLFLAFSVVTSLVTASIQKYGSLNNAIKALFGTITDLDKIQQRANKSLSEYNKELVTNNEILANASAKSADQVFKVQTLASAIKDLTLSETQRKNAIDQIQKLDPKTLENLSLQTKNYKDLDEFVKRYTDSLIANAVAQEYLSKVVATTTQINQQTNVLAELGKGYADIAKKRREFNDETIFDPATGAELTNTALAGLEIRQKKLNKEFSDQTNIVSNLWKQLDNYKNSARNATIESLKFFESTKDKTGKEFLLSIDAQNLESAFDLDTIIANLTKYGNALLDTSNSEKERKLALQKLLEINPEYFKGLSIEKKGLEQTKTSIEDLITQYKLLKSQREFDARASKLNAEFLKNQLKALEDLEKQAGKLQDIPNFEIDQLIDPSQFDKVFKGIRFVPKLSPEGLMIWDPIRKGAQLVQEEFTYVIKGIKNVSSSLKEGFKGLEIQTAIDEFASSFKTLGEVYDFTFKDIVEKNKEIASTIQGFLYQPLENVFDVLLSKGEKSWKEFGDAVIATIKRIAAQLLALTIAKGIANILAPGLGGISTGALGEFLGGGVRNPTFGGLEGGMQMNGQVVFVQRGSDLVGVLNRTNSTIGRIG